MDGEEKYYVGIDYGTSNTCASIYLNGKVKIAPNKMGERITPSVVLFENNKRLVGEEALCESIGNDKNFIYEVKRFIGFNYEEYLDLGFDKSIKYIVKKIDDMPKIEIDNNGEKKYYTAEEISAYIIKKIMQSVENFIKDVTKKIGIKIDTAIFTVPAEFNIIQRASLENAAKLAGIKIPTIINEPTAAALAYGFGHNLISKEKGKEEEIKPKENEKRKDLFSSTILGVDYDVAPLALQETNKIMVIDLGGGTYDISVINLKLNGDTSDFEVLLSDGDIHLGGSDFDNLLYNYCIDYFCAKNNINQNELLQKIDIKSKRKLKIKCENVKKMFNIKSKVTISIENFYEEEDLYLEIKDKEFKIICGPIYKRIEDKINKVLKELNFTKNNIDNVILVGGGSKIFGIRNILEKIFDKNKIKDDINPEEAISIGATLYAVKSQGNKDMNFNLQDIIPYEIGIGVKNKIQGEAEVFDLLIKRYTKFPFKMDKGIEYYVNLDKDHPDIIAKIYEGNKKKSIYIKDKKEIGNFYIKNLNKEGKFRYKINLEIDLNGKLKGLLTCNEELNNKTAEYKSINDISTALVVKKTIKISKNNNLSTAASMIFEINDKKEIIRNSQDFNIKLNNLEFCSKTYENIIKNYIPFTDRNPNLYEKLFSYTKELFELYINIIDLRIINKEKMNEIINNIKEKMKNLINEPDYVEELFKIFIVLKPEFCEEYYKIFVNYIELLNNKGNELSSKKSYNRYFVKLYFEKVFFSVKKYVIEKELEQIDKKIKENYDGQIKIANKGLKKTLSYAHYVETVVKEKKFEPGNTGYTWIDDKLKKIKENPTEEDIFEILRLFYDMAESFDVDKNPIEEAYCLAYIIVLNFDNLKNKNFVEYEEEIEKFKTIMKSNNIKEDFPIYKRAMEIIRDYENNYY